jgi:hypothetical protein
MNNAEAAFLGQCNGHVRLRNGVHGRRNQRGLQPNVRGKAGASVAVSGQNLRICWQQQHVVVGEGLEGNFGGCGIRHGKRGWGLVPFASQRYGGKLGWTLPMRRVGH